MRLNTIDALKEIIELEMSKEGKDEEKIKSINKESSQTFGKMLMNEFGISKEDSQFKNGNFLQKFALSVIGVILDFICYAVIVIIFIVFVSISGLFFVPKKNFVDNKDSNFLVNLLKCLIEIPLGIILLAIGVTLSIVVKTFFTISSAISSVKNISFFGDGGSGTPQSSNSQDLEEKELEDDPDLTLKK